MNNKMMKELIRAANEGDVEAQNCLGSIYRSGEGVEKDLEKALYWYEKAAKQGDIEAQEIITQIKQLRTLAA